MKKLSIVLAVLLLGATIGVAEDPIWIWGMGSRPADGPFSDPDGTFEEIGNQWVQEKFGIPGIRAEGSGNLEALRALIASGDVPDVIARVRFGADSVRLLTDLAKDGRLHALDKYFDDPENYPCSRRPTRAICARTGSKGRCTPSPPGSGGSGRTIRSRPIRTG